MSSLCRYGLENYDTVWKVKRHFKSLQKCHWLDYFEDWKKNKISYKNLNTHPTLFSYHQIHTFLILWIKTVIKTLIILTYLAILAQLFTSHVCVFIVSVRFRKLWQREWNVRRHFKSLRKCHWRDSFEDWKKNKMSYKNLNASSYPIFLSPNPYISYPLDPLSSVFRHYSVKSSLNSRYSVNLLNEELFKFKLCIEGELKSLYMMYAIWRLVLSYFRRRCKYMFKVFSLLWLQIIVPDVRQLDIYV